MTDYIKSITYRKLGVLPILHIDEGLDEGLPHAKDRSLTANPCEVEWESGKKEKAVSMTIWYDGKRRGSLMVSREALLAALGDGE